MAMIVQRIRNFSHRLSVMTALVVFALMALVCGGCWDTIQHIYACDDPGACPCDEETTSTESMDDTNDPTDTTETVPGGQGAQPPGWEGFGSPCDDDEDCQDINPDFVCVHSVLDLINAPGGFCTSCCNQAGKDVCAPGIDCVGADNVYLVCLTHCTSNSQCRVEEGWECRELYYISSEFPGDFCLPDVEHADPDPQYQGEMPNCDWPW